MKNITNILIAITLILSMNNCQKDPVNNDPSTETKKETYRSALERIHKNVMSDTSLDNIMYIDTTRFYGSFSSITWDTVHADYPIRTSSSNYLIREVPTYHPEYNKAKPWGIFFTRYKAYGWRGNDSANNWGGEFTPDTLMAIHVCDRALIATAANYGDAYYLLNSQIAQDSFQRFAEERIKNQPAEIRDYILNRNVTWNNSYLKQKTFIDYLCFQYLWEYDDRVINAYFDIKAGRANMKYIEDNPIWTSDLVYDNTNCYLNVKYVKLSDNKYHTVGYYKIFYKDHEEKVKPITGKIIMD